MWSWFIHCQNKNKWNIFYRIFQTLFLTSKRFTKDNPELEFLFQESFQRAPCIQIGQWWLPQISGHKLQDDPLCSRRLHHQEGWKYHRFNFCGVWISGGRPRRRDPRLPRNQWCMRRLSLEGDKTGQVCGPCASSNLLWYSHNQCWRPSQGSGVSQTFCNYLLQKPLFNIWSVQKSCIFKGKIAF